MKNLLLYLALYIIFCFASCEAQTAPKNENYWETLGLEKTARLSEIEYMMQEYLDKHISYLDNTSDASVKASMKKVCYSFLPELDSMLVVLGNKYPNCYEYNRAKDEIEKRKRILETK